MTWWRIVKQGKILTLPKTQLKITKPTKVKDSDCRDKLMQYAQKLLTMPMNFRTNNLKEDIPTIIENHYTRNGFLKNVFDIEEYGREEMNIPLSKTIDEIPEKICCAALDMLSAITLDRSSTKEVIDNWEIKCWYFTDKPRNYSINFSRFLDVNDTTYHYGNLSLMIKNTSAYEKCYFGWSVDAANGVWKDGYTPNVDWR
tara:strand:+ start:6083 stop:6682 length:600 start_codon:yes stop_codon:yes gene_type:complete